MRKSTAPFLCADDSGRRKKVAGKDQRKKHKLTQKAIKLGKRRDAACKRNKFVVKREPKEIPLKREADKIGEGRRQITEKPSEPDEM